MRKVLTLSSRGWRTRTAAALAVVGAMVMSGGMVALTATMPADATPGTPHKTWVCHATTSDSNPYVAINVDVASVKFAGHLAHRNTPNKFWKSAGSWNGIEHAVGGAQQPNKPDYIEGYDFVGDTRWEDGALCGSESRQPDAEQVTTTQEEMSCDMGYRSRSVTTTREYVWDDHAGDGGDWVLEPQSDWETVYGEWSYRALTDEEFVRLDCQPDQPDRLVVALDDERMTCEAGVEARAGTQTTTYVWNQAGRTYEPVVGPEVWGEWTFVRDLSDAEFDELECRPDQPGPMVVPLDDEQLGCDIGVAAREGEQTTTYVWNAETRAYEAVVGPEVWGEWAKVRNLTTEEFLALECVAGEETVVPKPTEEPGNRPAGKPVVLGTQTAVPTAVAAGVAGEADGSPVRLLGQLMVGGGLLLLGAGGRIATGRRDCGAHQA